MLANDSVKRAVFPKWARAGCACERGEFAKQWTSVFSKEIEILVFASSPEPHAHDF